MASWRCPHCGAAQIETAVCWVCRRSTVSCSSCLHFRRAIAGQLAYCSLDRARRPLTGDETRNCWVRTTADVTQPEAAAAPATPAIPSLWSAPGSPADPADSSVRTTGMWAESDTHPAAIPPEIPHAGSVRPRPWGRVPGLVEVPRGFREVPRRKG